jgi:predicted MFS family arabinose efflux permease
VTSPADTATHRFPLLLTGIGITQIIGWGTTYYPLGALSGAIRQATGWSDSIIFGAFSAALLLSGLIARGAGQAIDRLGGRRVMLAGSLTAAAACFTFATSASPLSYVAGWLLMGLAMRLATYDAAFATMTQIAGDKTRRAISILSLFGGLASTVFWPLGHWLATHWGWQQAFLVYGLLHLFICAPIHWFLIPPGTGARAAAMEAGTEGLAGPERRQAMLIFAAVLACNGFVFSAISAHVLALFHGLGLASASAVMLAALIGPFQVLARVGELLFGRRLSPAGLALAAFGLLPLALAMAVLGGFSLPTLALFAVTYGASNGLVTIAKGVYPLALFGRRAYGETLGTLTAPSLFLNAAAPLLMAWSLGHWGPQASLILCLASGLVSLGGMVFLARRHPA